MTANPIEANAGACYRCGYDLRGIADEAPCPECGLVVLRSRRETDSLHDTRPRWLRTISWGINLILLGLICCAVSPVYSNFVAFRYQNFGMEEQLTPLGYDFSSVLLLGGIMLLTRREGYPPADQKDRRLRITLRILAIIPIIMCLLLHISIVLEDYWMRSMMNGSFQDYRGYLQLISFVSICLELLAAPLPLFLFLHLRGLARRARSAHLAEHCAIVGIGASAAMVYTIAVLLVFRNTDSLGLRDNWTTNSTVSLVLTTLLGTACALFVLWSLYLLVRFAIAFWLAARNLNRKWDRDDRSRSESSPPLSSNI